MRQLINLRSILAAAALATGLAFTTTASAGNCHKPRCYYKTVTTWKIVEEPYYETVLRYDHCGKPYTDTVLSYRTVKVPVEKLVKVCY